MGVTVTYLKSRNYRPRAMLEIEGAELTNKTNLDHCPWYDQRWVLFHH